MVFLQTRFPLVDASESAERAAKIADLKREIAAGTYETPQRLEAAIDAFLDEDAQGLVRPGEDRPGRPSHPK